MPVVAWDPVPGASSYEVWVGDWNGSSCLWGGQYIQQTSVPEWAPQGHPHFNPVSWGGELAEDGSSAPTPNTYCIGVHARSDRATGNVEVTGSWTYLQNGNTTSPSSVGPAFTWTAFPNPADAGNSPLCNTSFLCDTDYLLPQQGSVNTRTPFFTWKPMAGAQGYFVVVAKDPSFATIVDEGFTWIPAYAPRNQLRPTTYTDETTDFYWEVLPSSDFYGGTAPTFDALLGAERKFKKQSVPPTLLYPVGRPGLPRPAVLPLVSDGGRAPLSPAGFVRQQLQQPPRRRDDRRDLVCEQHHLSGEHDPLLARSRGRREQDGLDLVGCRNLPEDADEASAEF